MTRFVTFIHRQMSFPFFAIFDFPKYLYNVSLFPSFSEPISGQRILHLNPIQMETCSFRIGMYL